MATIGHHRPRKSPIGDYATRCDYCGVRWLRSELRRDASGLLTCPDDDVGDDRVTLDKANSRPHRPPRPTRNDGGGAFHQDPTVAAVHILDLDQTAATIKTKTPAHHSSVAAPAVLRIAWSKWMNPGAGDVFIYEQDGTLAATLAAADAARDGWTHTWAISLVAGGYYVLIDADAFVDKNGLYFAGISDNEVWEFTVQ